ncbi:hypothetical protein LX99_02740 [Mucilaginibacter oryzae]|uniref:Uncharacterized protein n=1 Tax=Mucilaginibacter oryzae TaxID=468058 RepID=A0A316HHW6_9SPHI|nr:hypothetical protein [Mucilaginibacter oryzae]PWK77855.1 hypothetical protein LX99_02740 [Mucilaginibacter oryzae]
MKPKQIIIELSILIAIYLIAYFCWPVLFGAVYGSMTLDINMHDTYFAMSTSPWQTLVLSTFVILSTLLYFIRAAVKCYKSNLVNFILITCNFGLIIALIKIYRFILIIEQTFDANSKGWTIYPPLSALGGHEYPKAPVTHPHFDSYMFIPIIIFMLTLVISCIFTGKNWKTNTHEQTSA